MCSSKSVGMPTVSHEERKPQSLIRLQTMHINRHVIKEGHCGYNLQQGGYRQIYPLSYLLTESQRGMSLETIDLSDELSSYAKAELMNVLLRPQYIFLDKSGLTPRIVHWIITKEGYLL